MINCTITLNNTIGPDYSALNVTWTHNSPLATMLQATTIALNGARSKLFNSGVAIDSNELSDSGNYCCVAAVIGSGDTEKMNCVTLSVLGINEYITIFIFCYTYRHQYIRTAHGSNCWNYLQY